MKTIDDIKKKIRTYEYAIKSNKNRINFKKHSTEFILIDQRYEGWEIYYKNNSFFSQTIKIDFTLKMFVTTTSLKNILDEFENKRIENKNRPMHEITSEAINELMFNYGLFLVKEDNEKTKQFVNWYLKNSDEIYSNYLKGLKTRKII